MSERSAFIRSLTLVAIVYSSTGHTVSQPPVYESSLAIVLLLINSCLFLSLTTTTRASPHPATTSIATSATSATSIMDDLIANFTAITSADPARAQQYLTLTDGNLEQAIQLYFDSDGADMGASVSQTASTSHPSTSRPAYTEDESGVVTIDSDDEGDSNMGGAQPGSAYEDDEAMARRLQQEMYGQGAPEEVRAPMARTTETLVGPDADAGFYGGGGGDDSMQAAVMEQMMNQQRTRGLCMCASSKSFFSSANLASPSWPSRHLQSTHRAICVGRQQRS